MIANREVRLRKGREYQRRRWVSDKANCREIARRHRQKARRRNQQYVRDYLAVHPCMDCGKIFHHSAMDFDHVRGRKVMNVSQMAARSYSLDRIVDEIAKCDVRCANCHRVRTFKGLVAQGRAWK